MSLHFDSDIFDSVCILYVAGMAGQSIGNTTVVKRTGSDTHTTSSEPNSCEFNERSRIDKVFNLNVRTVAHEGVKQKPNVSSDGVTTRIHATSYNKT